MTAPAQYPSDITLTVDGDGIIRKILSAEALAGEPLDQWRGVRWTDTVPLEAKEQLEKVVDSALHARESSCFTVNQRLPSGRELTLEYTTVNLGTRDGFIAIGKNVQVIADLKSRLAHVQREREQDYWKLREIETRYRALLEASSEAVALVRVGNLRVVEANAAATRSLALVPGAEFLPDLSDRDRKSINTLLENVRLNGRAPGIVVHLLDHGVWSLRASMLTSEAGTFYLFQMSLLHEDEGDKRRVARPDSLFSIEAIVRRLPEGFVILDRDGVVKFANLTFLDLVQAGLDGRVVGKNAKQWFSRPGSGLRVILDIVEQHGMVRSLRTTLGGELGAQSEVEISAVGDNADRPRYFALIVRDVTSASRPPRADVSSFGGLGEDLSEAPLGAAVRSSVQTVEKSRLIDALVRSGGNRTVAAKTLGISRQSLHAKLKKYRLHEY